MAWRVKGVRAGRSRQNAKVLVIRKERSRPKDLLRSAQSRFPYRVETSHPDESRQ
jgi:hypothetical protein